MAEWTGHKRTLNSIIQEGVPPVDAASDHLAPPPKAPGATSSPQIPGMTPDDPDLPGKTRGTLPPLHSNLRPLTEYGSAQRLLRLFTPAPGAELEAGDWEQGLSAGEELRKADPALLTPFRPLPGYGLGIGRAAMPIAAESLEAVTDTAEGTVAAIPAAASELPASPEPAVHAIPAGAVAGDGTMTCPPGFPVKGNAQSLIYHTTASRSYLATIAEFCFATPEAAQIAGYRAAKDL
jgi:hypothetical protein